MTAKKKKSPKKPRAQSKSSKAQAPKKAQKSKKPRSRSKQPQPRQDLLLTPSEGQKVKLAIALLAVFLVGFSLATGALEIGVRDKGWHLSAIDTKGDCRMRAQIYLDRAPELRFYPGRG